MTTNEIKRILANKLHEEGTYFTFKDISITKAKMPQKKWVEEPNDRGYFKLEKVDAIKIVIKDYEHIHFFLTEDNDGVNDDYSNEVNLWRAEFDTRAGEYYEDGAHLIDFDYGNDYEKLYTTELIRLGYYIGSRF